MINLICGPKGTGKTKIILEKIDEAIKVAKGNVVLITDKKINTSKIDFNVRCVIAEEYNVKSAEAFRGFVNGLVAGNADIEYLFIDGLIRIIKDDEEGLDNFFKDIERLEKEYGFKVVLTISIAKEDLPCYLKQYAI